MNKKNIIVKLLKEKNQVDEEVMEIATEYLKDIRDDISKYDNLIEEISAENKWYIDELQKIFANMKTNIIFSVNKCNKRNKSSISFDEIEYSEFKDINVKFMFNCFEDTLESLLDINNLYNNQENLNLSALNVAKEYCLLTTPEIANMYKKAIKEQWKNYLYEYKDFAQEINFILDKTIKNINALSIALYELDLLIFKELTKCIYRGLSIEKSIDIDLIYEKGEVSLRKDIHFIEMLKFFEGNILNEILNKALDYKEIYNMELQKLGNKEELNQTTFFYIHKLSWIYNYINLENTIEDIIDCITDDFSSLKDGENIVEKIRTEIYSETDIRFQTIYKFIICDLKDDDEFIDYMFKSMKIFNTYFSYIISKFENEVRNKLKPLCNKNIKMYEEISEIVKEYTDNAIKNAQALTIVYQDFLYNYFGQEKAQELFKITVNNSNSPIAFILDVN